MNRWWIMVMIAGTGMTGGFEGVHAQERLREQIAAIARRDAITVLVTDSGLGGLSVAADIEHRARTTAAYRSIRIVFANALPEANRGYNRMPTVERKVQVFDDALAGMIRLVRPDVILVACNTLSVLIPRTTSAGTTPMLGIVEIGVDMLEERLRARPGSSAIVFGTETTVASDAHRSMLIARGIAPERIVVQACPDLAGQIEADAAGDVVATSIELFAGEAMERVTAKEGGIVAGLCCTHYGYCGGRFSESLQALAPGPVEVVNPNLRMSDILFPEGKPRADRPPEVSVQVVSRAEISAGEIRSIASLLEPVSPGTARALENYERKRELFPYEDR